MKKILMLLLMMSLCSCGVLTNESSSTSIEPSISIEPSVEPSIEPSVDSSKSQSSSIIESESEIVADIDVKQFENLPEIRFGSTFDVSKENLVTTYKMVVPYTDEYNILLSSSIAQYTIYNHLGVKITQSSEDITLNLLKGQIVYVQVTAKAVDSVVQTEITATENKAVMPYDSKFTIDPSSFDLYGDKSVNPLQRANINYIKRPDGMYINCNNPEKLTDNDLNKALCRNEITGDVFFTAEHNNGPTVPFYYGYQVKNTNDHDIYVTVKNIGFQLDGAGCWLGENEWIQFYNTKFTFDTSKWNEDQWKIFNDLYGFSGKYEPALNQPITYVLPAGEKMYVMGGTTTDSYKRINVFNSANKKVKGGCSNVAVLFSISGGTAEGAFYVYDDPSKIDETSHQGYITIRDGQKFGRQYVGYDTCHGVVDNEAYWVFNDLTANQALPVRYTTRYKTGVSRSGEPYSEIESTEHVKNVTEWITHINPQSYNNGVGTDMTRYITINENRDWIVIDSDHYDGLGELANIGNWMIDYQDHFTFVNQGDNKRSLTFCLRDNGSLAVMVKTKEGKVIDAKYTMTRVDKNTYSYEYKVDIPAHSVLQLTLGYNLLANSSGTVAHRVLLGD